MKKPYKLLVTIFFVGLIISLLSSSYLFFQGATSYYVKKYVGICFWIYVIFVFVCGIYFSKKFSKSNIFAFILAIIFIIPIIIFEFFASTNLSNLIDKKIRTIDNPRYQEAVQMVLKMNLPINYHEEYKLPLKYWELTRGWGIFIDKREDLINVSFPEKVGPLAGTFFVYSNLEKTIYDGEKYFKVIKKKPHWFYVIEY